MRKKTWKILLMIFIFIGVWCIVSNVSYADENEDGVLTTEEVLRKWAMHNFNPTSGNNIIIFENKWATGDNNDIKEVIQQPTRIEIVLARDNPYLFMGVRSGTGVDKYMVGKVQGEYGLIAVNNTNDEESEEIVNQNLYFIFSQKYNGNEIKILYDIQNESEGVEDRLDSDEASDKLDHETEMRNNGGKVDNNDGSDSHTYILGEVKGEEGQEISDPMTNPEDYPVNDVNLTGTETVINSILGAISVIGVVAGVIILVIIGIKYVMGSVEQKAEYKETAKAYILGAILIAASPTIVNILYQLAQSLNNP